MKKYCKRLLSALLAEIFVATPNSHAQTNATWAWPGSPFLVRHFDTIEYVGCSVGFPAWDAQGNHYFITAGHCFRSQDERSHLTWSHNSNRGAQIYNKNDPTTPIGEEVAYFQPQFDNSFLDISLVKIYPGKKLTGHGWQHIPNRVLSGGIGDKACLVGQNSDNIRCGTIGVTDVEVPVTDTPYELDGVTVAIFTVDGTNISDFCATRGDSGGAIFNEYGALGIITLGGLLDGVDGNCYGAFIPIARALNALHDDGYPTLTI